MLAWFSLKHKKQPIDNGYYFCFCINDIDLIFEHRWKTKFAHAKIAAILNVEMVGQQLIFIIFMDTGYSS